VLAIMVLAYQPAWWGTPIWDDDHHLTPVGLRGLDGLGRIWTDVGATIQYYPFLHTVFWLLHLMWGDAVLGYHLLNLVVHGICAALVLVALRRISAPGALLAASLFALHPIQVESVAWMTELKNTLSTCFYLLAAITYLRFDDTRRRGAYAASLAIFVLALLTKSVTGMLPFALVVVLWWKRGSVRPRTDLLPLIPFVILGVSMGLVTAWWEIEFNRTGTSAFALTWIERVLIGGRAALFQLGSLLWPSNLLFSYPRWDISAGDWRQFFYPMAVAGVLFAAWRVRLRTRAPLAAALFFLLNLAPTLGAFNIYTFRYSFVADHYQYIACIGIFALLAGTVWPWLTAHGALVRITARAGVSAALIVLALITWRQSHHYVSAEASYAAILRGNPTSWFAHANLGAVLLGSAPETAVHHLQEAVRLKPDLGEAHGNLGAALLAQGRTREAIAACVRALELDPRLPGANRTLADAYEREGRPDLALEPYQRALQLNPGNAMLHASLGQAMTAVGQSAEGLAHLRTAIGMQPQSADIRNIVGFALAQTGETRAAAAEHRRALELDPKSAAARYGLGNIYMRENRLEEAAAEYRAAVALDPRGHELRNNLGVVLDQLDRPGEAEREFRASLDLRPGFPEAGFNLARLLEDQGRLFEAATHYLDLLVRNDTDVPVRLRLAGVLVRLGKRAEAVQHVREALRQQPGYPIDDPLLKALIR
jgi:Flp pilus assembly protein TadD